MKPTTEELTRKALLSIKNPKHFREAEMEARVWRVRYGTDPFNGSAIHTKEELERLMTEYNMKPEDMIEIDMYPEKESNHTLIFTHESFKQKKKKFNKILASLYKKKYDVESGIVTVGKNKVEIKFLELEDNKKNRTQVHIIFGKKIIVIKDLGNSIPIYKIRKAISKINTCS